MSFSSGTFVINSVGNPVVTGTTISSTWANALTSDLATGLSTCVLKDGTQTWTANIPAAGFKLTGLGDGSAVADSVRVSQIQNSSLTTLTSVAGTNTITGTATPNPAAYASGQSFDFTPANANTGATTINISSLGAKSIFAGNSALIGGELHPNIPVQIKYDGTQFQLMGPVFRQQTRTPLASGSGTYTTPVGATRINVRMVGGGGGGAGSGTTATSGGNGGNTTFSTLSAGGGTGGNQFNPSGGGTPANGDINIVGSIGGAGNNITNSIQGGNGGAGPWGGLGSGGSPNVAGNAAAANSGAGGGGGGGGVGVISGAGGSSGGYVEKLITAPAATYSYGVGAAGTAGTAGTSGVVGGAGGSGLIIVDEYYN